MTAQTILPANSAASGEFNVANSVRLTGTNDYFHKTPSSSGSRRLFSFSAWVKKADFSTGVLFSSGEADGNPNLALYFDSSSRINMYSTQGMQYITTRVFRDPHAWYHIMFVVGTASSNANNRQQLYVNGVRETVFSTSNVIGQNENLSINTSAYRMAVGTGVDDEDYFGGYMAEVVFIDNQALAPTSFGEFDSDSGIWKPKNVNVLTLGTNGFYLNFQDSSNLGNDVNGGTDLTEVNLAATDQTTDTCTNNFATFNPLFKNTFTFSEGNCIVNADAGSAHQLILSTIAPANGVWYAEFKITDLGGDYAQIGIRDVDQFVTAQYVGQGTRGYGYAQHGTVAASGSNVATGQTSISANDIIGVWMDLDNQVLKWYINDTLRYTHSAVTATYSYAFAVSIYGSTSGQWEGNFGGCPGFAISSGNQDPNGYGNFEFATKSGYALCSKNLAEFGG